MAGRRRRLAGLERADGDPVDTYSVEALPDGALIIRHFTDPDAPRRCCCKIRVLISEADRAQAFEYEPADQRGRTTALHRAYLAIETKHAP